VPGLVVVAVWLAACGGTTVKPDAGACADAGADQPDDGFVDSNCDGVDGDAAASIFVATNGLDTNQGTMTQPMRTIQAALARAVSQAKPSLLVSEGTYDGYVLLVNGVSIYGGFSQANGWARNATSTVTITNPVALSGRVVAIEGKGLTAPTVLDRLVVQAGNAVAAGVSSVALLCTTCPGLSARGSTFTAGAGGAGTPGVAGAVGAVGLDGMPGLSGSCDGYTPGAGGTGGVSVCGRAGGLGGPGGDPSANSPGGMGGSGAGNTAGGAGGLPGDPGGMGDVGSPGTPGSRGASGGSGSGGLVANGFWVGRAGGDGQSGTPGNGGGGGGGGGPQHCAVFCIDGPGNGGGGGGAGGCAGGGGTGGTAGGASVGVFLLNSTGATLTNCKVASKSGGAGGAGGASGAGGAPGLGGAGQTTCSNEVGAGGKGGDGGRGGDGGPGGGGAGGPSYALALSGTAVPSNTNTTLTAGSGGKGGPSAGNPGADGAAAAVGAL
jgi:hypothetical protein